MIVFRQADARYPFLWETPAQPPGRWHGAGEGPAHYFSDTPDGAWAEFLRHEEIVDPADLTTIRRRIWAVDIGDEPARRALLPDSDLTGDRSSYDRCQAEARRMREAGARRIVARSAALRPGGARGYTITNGIQTEAPRDGHVIVVFGAPSGLVGWVAADAARPSADLLDRVHHFQKA